MYASVPEDMPMVVTRIAGHVRRNAYLVRLVTILACR
jgi:hypothetical protein